MANRIFASNDGAGNGTYTQVEQFQRVAAGSFSADSLNIALFSARAAGKISAVYLTVGTNATDATDALTLKGDVKINTVSALTTLPEIDGGTTTAGSGRKSTIGGAATGIVPAVVNTAANTFVAGDVITTSLDITAVTPDTNYTDVYLTVVVTYDAVANA